MGARKPERARRRTGDLGLLPLLPLLPLAIASQAGLRLVARGVDLGMPNPVLLALGLPAIAVALGLPWILVPMVRSSRGPA